VKAGDRCRCISDFLLSCGSASSWATVHIHSSTAGRVRTNAQWTGMNTEHVWWSCWCSLYTIVIHDVRYTIHCYPCSLYNTLSLHLMFVFFEFNNIWSSYLSCFPLLIDWLIDWFLFRSCWSNRLAEIDREMYPVHELIGRQPSHHINCRELSPQWLAAILLDSRVIVAPGCLGLLIYIHLGWSISNPLTPTSWTSLDLVSVDEQTFMCCANSEELDYVHWC